MGEGVAVAGGCGDAAFGVVIGPKIYLHLRMKCSPARTLA